MLGVSACVYWYEAFAPAVCHEYTGLQVHEDPVGEGLPSGQSCSTSQNGPDKLPL